MRKKRKIPRKKRFNFQKGDITLLLVLLLLPLLVLLVPHFSQTPPAAPPQTQIGGTYCRPEVVTSGSSGHYTLIDSSPAIKGPTYSTNDVRNITPSTGLVWYRRIKADVPILAEVFSGGRDCDETRQQCGTIYDSKHFQKYASPNGIVTVDKKRYQMYFPIGEAGDLKSKEFSTDTQGNSYIDFKDNHLLFLVQLEDTGTFAKMDQISSCIEKSHDPNRPGYLPAFGDLPNHTTKMWYVDIYQQVNPNPDGTASLIPLTYLPSSVLQCHDATEILCPAPTAAPVVENDTNKNPSKDKKQLQLETFSIQSQSQRAAFASWYTPQCKPAIYLYPEEKTSVHVSVNTKGILTYTDPLYPTSGWDVTAYPDGAIISDKKQYPYLYYESKIPDVLIQKPKEGYVVSYTDLANLYDTLLPKLGLSEKQTDDFSLYWQKALPKSAYYFVGVMPQNTIDFLEPLTITPKPATMVRVRLYFEALEKKITVTKPTIQTPTRSGFTVVEWGGMVKVDKNHPFTCSQ